MIQGQVPPTKYEPTKNVLHVMSSELLVNYALCHVNSGVPNILVIVMYAVYRVFNPDSGQTKPKADLKKNDETQDINY
jgi:hypothetical protein